MHWQKTFVQLDKRSHDRKSFDCEEEELNTFLQERAAKYMDLRLSATWVLPATTTTIDGMYPICAFYTLAHGIIDRQTLPAELAKKLPKYPVPIQLIAQMGIHKEAKGKGLGKITLVKALHRLKDITKQLPAYAVVVDCLNDDLSQFYEKYGFEYLCRHNERKRLFLPTKKLEKL